MKIDTEYLKYFWPMRHYLVSCGKGETQNIVAVGFCTPISKDPPMVACAIGHNMYSRELIEQTGDFVVNVPTEDLNDKVYYCGFHSGKDVDKFNETGLTSSPARQVASPIVEECVAHIECEVEQVIEVGDKVLFIAAVLDAYANEDVERGEREPVYATGDFPKTIYGTRYTCLDGKDE